MKYKTGDKVVLNKVGLTKNSRAYELSEEGAKIVGISNGVYKLQENVFVDDTDIDHEKTAELIVRGEQLMKYKVGDKVVLRDDLEDGKFYGQEKYVECTKLRGMETILGKEVEVCDIDTLCYIICGTPAWRITDDMIDHEKTATLNGENYAKYMEEQINDPAYQELLKELSEPVVDTVNHPPHYTQGKIEVIDIIKVLTNGYTGYQGYLVGNVVKYIARANFKGNKLEDLKKAEFYYNRLLEVVEGEK